jgi:integrase
MMIFQSVFSERLSAYIQHRRALGFRSGQPAYFLKAFDRLLFEKNHIGPLTQELALEFACANAKTSKNYCASRYKTVRHFSEYLAAFDPQTPFLDPKALKPLKARTPRHIYTDEELQKILTEARSVSRNNPIWGLTLHTMIGLAASTGLRIGEIIRLDREDVDLKTGTLNVQYSKFNKSRLVPLHQTTLEVVRNYAAARDAAFPNCKTVAFFVNTRQKRCVQNTVQQLFAVVACRAGLRDPKGRGPTFHDLRHRFATERLVLWYEAGIDVQAMLPALATYMGHTHYTDTAYYLTATAKLMALASERYQRWRAGKEAEL